MQGGEEEERGNMAFAAGKYEAAIQHYTEALKVLSTSAEHNEAKATVLCNRSAAFAR